MSETPVRTAPAGVAVHRVPRDVVEFVGPDAGAFLHSQFANDLAGLAPRASVHSLLLEPTGHLVCVTRVTRVSDERWLVDVDEGFAAALMDRLRRFVLRAKVTIAPVDMACVAVGGPGAREWAQSFAVGETCVAAPWWAADAAIVHLVGPAEALPEPNAPADEIEIERADRGWPRMGVDLETGDLPATTGLLGVAVSFTKGCYPGQELVERMDSRGAGAPVALRVLPAGSLRAGDEILDGDRVAGTVTSAGRLRVIARIKRGSEIGDPPGPVAAD